MGIVHFELKANKVGPVTRRRKQGSSSGSASKSSSASWKVTPAPIGRTSNHASCFASQVPTSSASGA